MVRAKKPPYSRVITRCLVWEGRSNQTSNGVVRDADEDLRMVRDGLKPYSNEVLRLEIPKDPRARAPFRSMLQNKFRGFASGSPSTLIILYYQGHGGLDSHGHLKLSNGAGEKMHWSEIANAIVDAPCDVLTILNCCHAGAAARARVPARPNYEQHLKELIMATSVEAVSGWGTACNFAPCLEQALREQRTDWEQGFNGTPYHWMQAINRNMEKKRASARVNHVDLVKPPSNARQRPIILAPRQLC